MLRNAAINTVEENRATLHRYIGTNRKSKRTPPDLDVCRPALYTLLSKHHSEKILSA